MDVNKYVGIPFKIHGRDFDGLDCYGLVHLFYKEEFDIELPMFLGYEEKIESYADKIEESKPLLDVERVDKPDIGDIGLFSYRGVLSHVGVYVGRNRVLHILMKTHSVCIKVDHPTLRGRLEGWYRYAR